MSYNKMMEIKAARMYVCMFATQRNEWIKLPLALA